MCIRDRLGNVSASIEDIIATQDQVTAEQEGLLEENEKRLRELEEDQLLQQRKNAFDEIINDFIRIKMLIISKIFISIT